ncbi:hypothetical protein FHX44_116823 [Pseudonocardia hierapolitana]|uniref:Uncharacterized protein n=1 Tax=Pseudonocardia hierapolitana TaxID=1128676 RepID=A0A561T196_9PSEU|nr:hypothetical protein FHX44_116823 [Pseudonocardia hierapolitana]
MQHHPVALAEHVHGAAEGHDEVLHPLAASPAEGVGGAGELHERGDVVAVGETDLDEHVTVLTDDGVDGLRSRGPQEPGELGGERWLGWRSRRRVGGHRLGRVGVAGSGEHPRSIPLRSGAMVVHPLGGTATAPTGHLLVLPPSHERHGTRGPGGSAAGGAGSGTSRTTWCQALPKRTTTSGSAAPSIPTATCTRPSDGRPLTQRARIGPSNPVVITLRTPIG